MTVESVASPITHGGAVRRSHSWVIGALLALAAGGAVAALALSGIGQLVAFGAIGVAAGVFLLATVLMRFELFILILLATRASLDLTDDGSAAAVKPASLLAMMMIGASVVWLWDNRHALPPRRWSAFTLGYAAFAVACVLSVIPLVEPMPVVGDVLAVVGGLLMALVVERLLMLGMPLKRLVVVLAGATLAPIGLGLVGDRLGLQTYHMKEGVSALRSTFVLSNNFAYFLMPVVLLAIPIGHRLHGARRLGLYLLAAVACIELVVTYTRGAWLGFVLGVVVVAMLENRRILLWLIAMAAAGLLLVPGVRGRLTDLESDPDAPRDESSLQWRFDHWSDIIDWNASNRVTGIGLGMVAQLDDQGKAPHNDYVRTYVETGVLGLAAYLLMMFGYLRAGWLAHRRRLPGWRGGLAVGIFAWGCAFAVTSLAENLIVSIALLWYAMTLGAIANWLAYNDSSIEHASEPRRVRIPEVVPL